MNEQITAAVIGAGRFGKNYLHCLSELNRHADGTIPYIRRLIISKTRHRTACRLANDIMNQYGSIFSSVVGLEVKNRKQLKALLSAYRPELICIAARDKLTGDSIHADYTQASIRCGAVLCEKPFSRPTRDMAGAKILGELMATFPPGRFGLDLPMAVVARNLMLDPKIYNAFNNSERVEFEWGRPKNSGSSLIDDLAIHPWSLIPLTYKTVVSSVAKKGTGIEIVAGLIPEKAGREKECRILLKTGSHLRCMKFDGGSVRFVSVGRDVHVFRAEDRFNHGSPGGQFNEPPLLKVENPLKQQIVAVLRSSPVVDMVCTYASEMFLQELLRFS